MATVTGLTAARMIAIEAASVVSGTVSGNDLILEKFDGSTMNAGNVRGATGATGATGPAGVQPPTGCAIPFAGGTAPTGWLLCQGQEISRTTYAALYTVIGDTYGAGDGSTTFLLPDLQGRAAIGAGLTIGLGEAGGSSTISEAQLPLHSHGPGTLATNSGGAHLHAVRGSAAVGGNESTVARGGTFDHESTSNPVVSNGAHTHTVTSGETADAGAGAEYRPPYLGLNFIIKT